MYNFKKDPVTGETIRRKDYSSERGYLEAVYERHSRVINEAFGANAKEKFISRAVGFKTLRDRKTGQPLGTISKALTRLGNMGDFYNQEATAHHNVIRGLKTTGMYQEFRELTKDARGRYQKVTEDDFKWNRKAERWEYKGIVAISFTDSPFGAYIGEI